MDSGYISKQEPSESTNALVVKYLERRGRATPRRLVWAAARVDWSFTDRDLLKPQVWRRRGDVHRQEGVRLRSGERPRQGMQTWVSSADRVHSEPWDVREHVGSARTR